MNTSEFTISDFLYFCEHTRCLDSKTLRAYRTDLTQYSLFLNSNNLPYAEKSTLALYLQKLHSNFAPLSAKRKIASLKRYFHYQAMEHNIPNPFASLDTSFQQPKHLPRYIPLHIMKSLIKTIQDEILTAKSPYRKHTALRNLAVVELLFSTGIRVSELCELPVSHVDLQSMEIKICGKGSKERILQLNTTVTKTLKQFQKNHPETNHYFFPAPHGSHLSDQTVRRILTYYASKISSPIHLTPHMIRHTFAKSLLDQGIDIRIIQQILGHSSISTTEIYTYVSSNKQKQVLKNKNPLFLIEKDNI